MNKSRGFTTLELVIALAILGLLITVALMSFSDHVTNKSRRLAWAALQDAAQWMHLQHRQTGSFAVGALPYTQSPMEGDAEYRLSLAAQDMQAQDPNGVFPGVSAQTFTLVATPVDGDEDCGALLLDHAGRRGVAGAMGVRACSPD